MAPQKFGTGLVFGRLLAQVRIGKHWLAVGAAVGQPPPWGGRYSWSCGLACSGRGVIGKRSAGWDDHRIPGAEALELAL